MRYLSSRSRANDPVEILKNVRVHLFDIADLDDGAKCLPGEPCEYCQAIRTVLILQRELQSGRAIIVTEKTA